MGSRGAAPATCRSSRRRFAMPGLRFRSAPPWATEDPWQTRPSSSPSCCSAGLRETRTPRTSRSPWCNRWWTTTSRAAEISWGRSRRTWPRAGTRAPRPAGSTLNRHSLIYRLRKFEELTGRDLGDPADRFVVDLSIKLFRLRALSTASDQALKTHKVGNGRVPFEHIGGRPWRTGLGTSPSQSLNNLGRAKCYRLARGEEDEIWRQRLHPPRRPTRCPRRMSNRIS